MDAEAISFDFRRYFAHTLGRDDHCTSSHYPYKALALAVRDRLIERWKRTRSTYENEDCKRTFYLSLEFLMGRTLSNAILNLDVSEEVNRAFIDLGINLDDIRGSEPDAGLGNGGLGRLAACFLDSCATLELPVRGYGLRYEYGMFRQHIANGYQIEDPDHWLRDGNPWELERPEYTQRIKFCGHTEHINGSVRWVDTQDVLAVPYDLPVPGYRNGTVNTLRLWKAAATDEFNLEEFNAGSYTEAVEAKNDAEHITMVLYPNDASENGKELRLRQQYFLASASIKDVIREWKENHGSFDDFADKNCFQLNDTHPSVSVAELMRQLMDEQGLSWDQAWMITGSTMAYTNHTLLPEALERWPVKLFECLLPRLLEIIYEINARFLSEVALRWPGDTDRLRRMSIIEEGQTSMVRMAYLAIVGSFSVNGVAALHTELLKQGLFHDFYEFWPQRFNNKTNGVTPRRWLAACNPGLRRLLDETVGNGWISDLPALEQLVTHAENASFQRKWQQVKRENKQRLADLVKIDCNVGFDCDAMFDVQVKRIHEYKRQLLNILHVIHLYNRIKAGDTKNWTKRCVLIGGKAAPGYQMAKLIIKLVNSVARVVNNDYQVGDLLKVAFLPNYRVSAMEVIAPGSDLSEQISTAGKEASGTGNMKFMMNGAVTIGTLDGANIEILEEVGESNFILFGLTSEEVEAMRHHYMPNRIIDQDSDFKRVMQLLESGYFNQFEPGIFDPVIESIRNPYDPWMTAADFRSYIDAQEKAAKAYLDQRQWIRMSIVNSAKSGRFSTDRTIQEYNRDIWRLNQTSIPSVIEDVQ
ncbi:MAG: glycogen/starch/alpha-glucan phosphorylase [Candidatus Thiodiazotropha endolucinida]|uniref:Alpha-1,4 glucan phosphorylase n=1 Tax=Candidatus Thiodiazotropha taylori TaxID=2792791 RepID=A0A9E4TRK6_9GAMM|nr:glycogen/starch/alpha-glucan phosphorylase [Candidatus Thiodiazotropha taylori]MBT3091769.1 glycogen/starch/alpha-glucan phosphorylase [Candidatus Thiodiazotropha sp. (ex Lucina pensylvanica)]MCG7863067.1 glycogen/starch/alpha-glucan phosphorylase [Candidatus Thiodiazotropha endolucinida]MCG7876513.1 glycogen/starch/alpha-glucan phosphorylase [Candidatus Thiodiazotropha taylori]MCG7880369.1 glycogen/starch/alpha-glucan phosphorylase [Candidatus Thiodiazotropha taylori]